MTDFTHEQVAQRAYFDQKYADVELEVDFKHYFKPRFGPWCPYRHVYDLVSSIANKSGGRLLEVGCGSGANSLRYARLGYQVDGIDISPKAIEAAQELARRTELDKATRFSAQPAESLDFADGEFEVVVGVNILHHTDTTRVIPEVSRVLRKGGMAIFKEPLATPIRDRLRRSPLVTWLVPIGVKNLRQHCTYSDSEGEHMLDKTDFRIFEDEFESLEIRRWRVIAKLAVFGGRQQLERLDWWAFRMCPFLRRFGDQAVLIAKK